MKTPTPSVLTVACVLFLTGCSEQRNTPAPQYQFLVSADGVILWRVEPLTGRAAYAYPRAEQERVWRYVKEPSSANEYLDADAR